MEFDLDGSGQRASFIVHCHFGKGLSSRFLRKKKWFDQVVAPLTFNEDGRIRGLLQVSRLGIWVRLHPLKGRNLYEYSFLCASTPECHNDTL